MNHSNAALRAAKALFPHCAADDPKLLAAAETIERELNLKEVISAFDALLVRFNPGDDGPTRKKARRVLKNLQAQ
jgi:hypothetical protein